MKKQFKNVLLIASIVGVFFLVVGSPFNIAQNISPDPVIRLEGLGLPISCGFDSSSFGRLDIVYPFSKVITIGDSVFAFKENYPYLDGTVDGAPFSFGGDLPADRSKAFDNEQITLNFWARTPNARPDLGYRCYEVQIVVKPDVAVYFESVNSSHLISRVQNNFATSNMTLYYKITVPTQLGEVSQLIASDRLVVPLGSSTQAIPFTGFNASQGNVSFTLSTQPVVYWSLYKNICERILTSVECKDVRQEYSAVGDQIDYASVVLTTSGMIQASSVDSEVLEDATPLKLTLLERIKLFFYNLFH